MAFRHNHLKREENEREKTVLRRHMFQYWWVRALAVLASLVVFCTVYALILPAAAITGTEAKEEAGFYLENEENSSEQEAAYAYNSYNN